MRVLGLMSGTSCDGVSAALVAIGRRVRLLEYRTLAYPAAWRRRLLACDRAMDAPLGEFFGRVAREFRAEAIGSHGHTVLHVPGVRSVQIGDPAAIARLTGRPVVADFRPYDIAAGGQGAPLVPKFDEVVFGGGPPRILQNIGGIANLTLVGAGRTIAFDTGPGNCWIDAAARRRGRPMDEGGALAAREPVDLARWARLARHPYFGRRPPKSTGRETFGDALAPDVATATFLTAWSIAEAYRRFVPAPAAEAIVSGGGVYNRTLMAELADAVWPRPVRSIEEYGWHPLAKEPAAFALLAYLALKGRPNNVPSATGARREVIMGRKYLSTEVRRSRLR
jgi:anhydro-N-acetylmuramic acid kinase